MSVIALGEALNFLDRTTKDRTRAQAMKKFLQEDVIPKLVSHTAFSTDTSITLCHTLSVLQVTHAIQDSRF